MAQTRHLKLYAGGKMKGSPLEAYWHHYAKQIHWWTLSIKELTTKDWSTLAPIRGDLWILLEEGGTPHTSLSFSQMLQACHDKGRTPVFLLGDFHGFPPCVKSHPHTTFSLGGLTWPHLLARVLLLEQLYRAQQRWCHHPYSFT